MRIRLQFFGGRGSAGGTNVSKKVGAGKRTSDTGKSAGERNPDRIKDLNLTKPSQMANQVYDMISPNSSMASSFEDKERTATIRTYMDKVLKNPKSFRSEWLTNQRVANFADEHGGGKRFPKLKAYKAAIEKQESYRQTSNAMEAGFRRQDEEERQRDIERRRRR